MNMSQASYTTPSSFEENDEIYMVAERERNFFKEISQSSAQRPAPIDASYLCATKTQDWDEQSGVLIVRRRKARSPCLVQGMENRAMIILVNISVRARAALYH